MEDFIKNIIVEKRYFELTPKEKSIILDWASNEEEFDALKMTFLSVSELNIENEKQLSPKIKQSLNERFAAKHAIQNEGYWNRFLIFLFPKETHFFKKPAFQLVMVALTVALIIPFLWQNKPAQYAMNENNIKIDKLEDIDHKKIPSAREKKEVILKNEIEIPKDQKKESKEEGVVEIYQSTNEDIQPDFDLEQNIQPNEIYLEEIAETQSAKIVNADIQQLDEMPMISSKDVAKADNKKSSKQVDASETLGLLTALF